MITINGIYNDIMESTYYSDQGKYRFYFSSPVYRQKFESRLESYCEIESKKLELKYHTPINFDELLMFNLYQNIEKRGFRVEVDSEVLKESPLFQLKSII